MSPLDIMKKMRTLKPNYKKAVRYGLAECAAYSYQVPSTELLGRDEEAQYTSLVEHLQIEHAKYLYYKHMKIDHLNYPYMWNQCNIELRTSWYVIALADFEDPLD
jgi:hypothetical protein